MTEDEMVEWHHRLNGYEFEQTPKEREKDREIPSGPVVKSLPFNAGDMGSIPGQRSKIPHALGQISLCTPTKEPTSHNEDPPHPHVLQLRPNTAVNKEMFF